MIKIKQFIQKILKLIPQHKFIAGIIVLAIIFGGYFGFKAIFNKNGIVHYVFGQVQKGTLIVSISGSGQVLALNQVDIKPKVSGDVVYVGAKNGQQVRTGALLVQLDVTDAQKTVRDAEINLQREQLSLDKMKGITTDDGTIRGVKEKAEDDIQKAYEDGFNTIANVFLELPGIMAGLNDMLFSHSFNASQENIAYYANVVESYDEKVLQYKEDAYDKYQIARKAYDQNFQDYKTASRFSEPSVIESLIEETYETTKNIAEAIKSANNLIQFYQDEFIQRNLRPQSLSDTHLSNLSTYTGKTNGYLLNILSIKNTLLNDKETIVNTTFDIADQEIKVTQAEDDLLDAKEKLNDYFIRATFDGTITKMDIERGNSAGSSTIIATLITKQKIAEISLNEVDVAKIKVGQKATLTFDAVSDLNITGEVVEVDSIGTISQGVVTYNVKVTFDTQDERVKPAMSVSAAIITDARPDVLLLQNSALKQQNEINYVEMTDTSEENISNIANVNGVILEKSPRRQQVEIGASNDEYTEITNGLKEEDYIIVRTIQANSTQSQSQTQSQSIFRLPTSGGTFRRD
jgi:HlyD family secretion protein